MHCDDAVFKTAINPNITDQEWNYFFNYNKQAIANNNRIAEIYYRQRLLIEYAVKATITVSMLSGLFFGGPLSLVITGAAAALKLTTSVFNLTRFKPKMATLYLEKSSKLPGISSKPSGDNAARTRQSWIREYKKNCFDAKLKNSVDLMRKLSWVFVAGFGIFVFGSCSASITPLEIGAYALYAYCFLEKAKTRTNVNIII